MKRKRTIAALFLPMISAGCLFFFGEFRSRDSLENATTTTWTVVPKFDSGRRQPYEDETYAQASETTHQYQGTGRGEPLPTLTNIVVRSWDPVPVQYSLSATDIAKLRHASGGKLRLLLYDGGIPCMPPNLGKVIAEEQKRRPVSKQDYFRKLRDMKQDAMNWTLRVLGTE
jgi:hypothetical protein